MERDWIYLQNTFLNATNGNFSKFNSIITYSHGRFEAQEGDAFFDTVRAIVNPAYDSWFSAYTTWVESQGEHKATTVTVQELFDELKSELIGSWARRIAVVYAPGTAGYIRLLPNGNAPFQTGSQEAKITALNGLSSALVGETALTTVKTEVDNFITELTAAKAEQTADLSSTDLLSDACEVARVGGSIALWQSLGMMIKQFAETPTVIGNYYDQENLRAKEQVSFTLTVHPGSTAVIVKRKLTDGMQIRIINNSMAEVRAFYAAEKNDDIGSAYFSVAANEDDTTAAGTLGNLAEGHFIKVFNPDVAVDAHFTLIIIK